jgi:hypothetical protein
MLVHYYDNNKSIPENDVTLSVAYIKRQMNANKGLYCVEWTEFLNT